jgi:hypothetical protein
VKYYLTNSLLQVCEFILTVIFSHQRKDLEVGSRTRRTCSSFFNMQGITQPKSNSLKSLGDAEFDCKYPELVY